MRVSQKILIMLFALGANMTSVFAINEKEFCESFVYLLKQTKETKQKLSLSSSLKITFAPRMLIDSNKVNEIKSELLDVEGSKHIFIHLDRPVIDQPSIDSFRQIQVRVNELPIINKLKEAKNLEACMSIVSESGGDFKIVQDYIEQDQVNQKKIKALTEIQMNTVLRKKLKVFERKGWTVQFMTDLFEMYEILNSSKNISQVMLIMHSDENGKVYDAKMNAFPKGAFSNLPASIKKFMIFSCHGEKVVEFYNLKNKTSEFDYYYPTVDSSAKSFYETKVPLVAIKGMLKAAKQGVTLNLVAKRSCKLEIEAALPGANLVIALNDEFIGTFKKQSHQKLNFDCNKLNNTFNRVNVYHLGTTQRISPAVKSMTISTSQETRTLKIKEHLSQINNQHILTNGITGGIQ